jgi:Kef-type K+ transport system membrane component KefB
MNILEMIQHWFSAAHIPILLVIGILTFIGLFSGKTMRFIRLPSIIGYMLIGVICGPSLAGILSHDLISNLSFLPEIALSFVALSIGLELHFPSLKRESRGIVVIILSECLLAFAVTAAGIYLLTRNLPLALIFGSIAPASAPAGTVAIIQEYKAKGPLTRALYSVVGFDDGFGIIIFGFAAAIAKSLLSTETGAAPKGIWQMISTPLLEVGLSIGVGAALAFIFILIARKLKGGRDLFIFIFAVVLIGNGLSILFHLSSILTNMVLGIVIVNTQRHKLVEQVRTEIGRVLPLLFVLFFVLAGANLHIAALPALGLIGLVYIACRSTGLIGGAWFGAAITRAPDNIRKYLGIGILSQAGVAIGLALIVSNEFSAFGETGAYIGKTVITTVTATSIFFEIIGPILTKIGLKKAEEIGVDA